MFIRLLQQWKWHALLFCSAAAFCLCVISTTPVSSGSALPAPAAPYPPAFSLAPAALQADAAIVYDPKDGRVVYAKNADMPLPLASLTKLMTADVVLAKENPNAAVVITPQDVSQINDPGDLGLQAGQKWSIGALVRYGLFSSSNNAMLAAAGAVSASSTVAAMNETAAAMKLSGAAFYNPTGLDVSADLSGGYGSAQDVAVMAAKLYADYPAYFEETMRPDADFGEGGGQFTALPTAAPIQNIPGVDAAKTGYTDLAGGNMAAVFDISLGVPLVAVVLHSTEQGRFADIRTLIEAARQAAQ
jgi:D-alanyl-D-alanine carboxypeptidase